GWHLARRAELVGVFDAIRVSLDGAHRGDARPLARHGKFRSGLRGVRAAVRAAFRCSSTSS
ncbi:hypothetical protein ACFQ60_47555, partial [Streptomyces zhihengii]